ncbi:hypothetical protein, partial [Streptomyces regalis]|uniref:hypothetical protein n=1 Tax=Streptomyces regalis TaxID=68262 RepID=UPI003CC625E4
RRAEGWGGRRVRRAEGWGGRRVRRAEGWGCGRVRVPYAPSGLGVRIPYAPSCPGVRLAKGRSGGRRRLAGAVGGRGASEGVVIARSFGGRGAVGQVGRAHGGLSQPAIDRTLPGPRHLTLTGARGYATHPTT